jgi:hypothetical protein
MSERVRAAAAASAASLLAAETAWRRAQNLMTIWSRDKSEENLRACVAARAESEAANERYRIARTELALARAEFVSSQLGRREGWP